jgi:hypothetical protein
VRLPAGGVWASLNQYCEAEELIAATRTPAGVLEEARAKAG